MPFCIHCGQQNQDSSQFCIRCGKALLNPVASPQQAAPPPQNTAPPVQPVKPAPLAYAPGTGSKNNSLLTALLIVGILGLGVAVYFIFFNNKKSDKEVQGNKPDESITVPIQEPAPVPPPANDTIKRPVQAIKRMQVDGEAVSEYELDQLSKTINGIYDAENRDDMDAVLDYFSYPVDRYYDMYNVYYADLQTRFEKAMVNKLSYHHITPDYTTSQVKRTGDSYVVTLRADFEYITYKTPNETKNRQVIIQLKLNSEYKITSAYEL